MNKPLYITSILCFILGMQGCITEYHPSDIQALSDILVVESTISNDTTHVKLSRSVNTREKMNQSQTINDAIIYVETVDGSYKQQGISTGNGNYTIATGELNPATQYRLFISTDGEDYASEYLTPLITPEIDSITWIKRGQGELVYMCVSTHGTEDQSIYYRWSYEENWEVKAELFANAAYINKKVVQNPNWPVATIVSADLVFFDLQTSNNRYYCWGKDSSKTILLESSEKLGENIISQKKLIEIAPSDERISILYHLAVQQTSLRKEAYHYYSNLQKNIEQTSGIFSTMPSEMNGNIHCLSNTDIPVIGYVEVATITTKEQFVPTSTELFEPAHSTCGIEIKYNGNYILDLELLSYPSTWAPPRCVNCLLKYNASKNKPAWWPTSHL